MYNPPVGIKQCPDRIKKINFMKTIRLLYPLFVIFFVFVSCEKGDEVEETPTNDVVEWIQPKVEDYEYSMTFISQVAFPDGISQSANTVVAAVYGEECRGKAILKYETDYDLYICYLTIVSNALSGEKITLNVYDGDNKKLYKNVQVIDFANNKTLGSAREVLICNK